MTHIDLTASITALKDGNIIVYPTDTLYALGADIYNDDAVKKIFKIKKRPFTDPLPVAVSDYTEIDKIAYTNRVAERLSERFLPGPLTIILRKKFPGLDTVTGGLDKIAVRIPDNNIALHLLSRFGPLTVTSANIHGEKTPYVIKEIKMQFRKNDVAEYLDDGRLDNKPSTIVDLTSKKPVIIRKGAIAENEILEAI